MHMMDARVTPTTLIRSKLEGLQFRELEPIDREVPLEQYDYSQNPCSQGFLGRVVMQHAHSPPLE